MLKVVEVARDIWYRGRIAKVKYTSIEDCDFHYFCCPLLVAGEVWDMLQGKDMLPKKIALLSSMGI